MTQFKAIGGLPVSLHSGRVLEPGETVNQEDLAPEDQVRVDRGQLVELPETRKPRAKKEEEE